MDLSIENAWKNRETYQGNDERTKRKNNSSNVGQSSEDRTRRDLGFSRDGLDDYWPPVRLGGVRITRNRAKDEPARLRREKINDRVCVCVYVRERVWTYMNKMSIFTTTMVGIRPVFACYQQGWQAAGALCACRPGVGAAAVFITRTGARDTQPQYLLPVYATGVN